MKSKQLGLKKNRFVRADRPSNEPNLQDLESDSDDEIELDDELDLEEDSNKITKTARR